MKYFNYRPIKDFGIITEEYHITASYIPVVKEIEKIYKNNINNTENKTIYTGYNLNIDTLVVSKLNNENKFIPIYVKLIYTSDRSAYAAICDKDDYPDKIIIELNINYINGNIYTLRSSCQHEFLHAREMYAKSDINILKNRKNLIPENEICKFTQLHLSDFNIILNICYIFNKAEERARLNGLYINILDNKDKYLQKSYKDIILDTSNISSIDTMSIYIDKVDMRGSNFLFIEALTYYMYKFSLIKHKPKLYHFNLSNIDIMKFKNNEIYDIMYNNIMLALQYNYDQFYKNLHNIIYKALHT